MSTREDILQRAYLRGFEKGAQLAFGPHTPDSATAEVLNEVAKALRKGDTNVPTSSTVLRRHAVPVNSLSPRAIRDAGFLPSYVAVPERGQSSYRTYRHPYNNMHLHRHGDSWLAHEDSWPAFSMALARWNSENPGAGLREKAKALGPLVGEAMSHGLVEGVPGWLTHIRGTILGERGFDLPGRSIPGQPAGVQALRGAAAVAAAGLIARGVIRKPGAGRSAAATAAGALTGSVAAAKLHQALYNRGAVSAHPTIASALMQVGMPAAGGLLGWLATRRYRGKEDEKKRKKRRKGGAK